VKHTHTLSIDSLTQRFGGLVAVNDVSLAMNKGEIVGVIGPNGAGTTTLFNCITGMYRPTGGSIHFDGIDITGKKPYAVTRLGMARTFQNIRLFPNLTVEENVMVGAYPRLQSGFWDALFRLPRHWRDQKAALGKANEVLELCGLSDWRHEYATSLPYGLQRRLEIARAIASEPQLLLFDEPAAGMNEQETQDLTAFIKSLQGMGYGVLLIEHDMLLVMNLCERIYVLDHGQMIAHGTPGEIKANPLVVEAYLGKGVG
jgi:branched-chain amino acid transport system ATP-binding protein